MNINDKVKVQLTPFGADIWNKQYDSLKIPADYIPTKVKPLDYIETQLWDAMNVFGPHIGLGKDVPFVDCQMEIM
jgi:hypothetical protein